VKIGPPQSGSDKPKPKAAGKPVPARKVAPKGAAKGGGKKPAAKPAAEAAEKKKGGTLERLRAERQAEAGTPKAAKPKPAAKAGPRGAASKSTRRSARPSSRRRPAQDDGDLVHPKHRGGRTPAKRSPTAGIIGIGAIVVIAIGVFVFKDSLFGSGGDPANVNAAETGASDMAAAGAGAMDEAASDEPVMADAADDAAASEPEPEPEPEPAKTLEKVKPKTKKGDPTTVDLAAEVPQFGPAFGMSDADFAKLTDDVDLMLANEGIDSSRAERRVKELGIQAVPAVINKMKTFDYGTEQGYRDGDLCQRVLEEVHAGMNFGWAYSTEDKDHYYNKRAVVLWGKLWGACETDLENFIKKTGLDDKDPAKAKELRAQFGGGSIEGTSEDDLEVD
jgi:hypothetical protein